MQPDQVAELVQKTRHVQGWFSFEAAMLFAWINQIQTKNGVVGDIFEIGVHHGKSAVLLALMIQGEREVLGICDLFGEQSQNLSGSGGGNRAIFEANMRSFCGGRLPGRILAKPSQDIDPNEIGRKHRFFHIDGGHNADEALNDLKLAATVTLKEGVIVVDDPFRPEWPGVSEAIVEFLAADPRYCGVLVGFNKMIIVRRDFATLYASEFDRAEEHELHNILYPWHMKVLPFSNYPLRIFYIPTYLSPASARARLAKFRRVSKWGRLPVVRHAAAWAESVFA